MTPSQRVCTLTLWAALVASMLATFGAAQAAQARPRTVWRPPPSIDGSGRTDVTAALQRFFDGVPDGAFVVLPGTATYRVDGTITLVDRNDLVIEGAGATFKAVVEGDRNRAQVRITGGHNLTIRDLIVVGANPLAGVQPDAYRPDRVGQQGFDLHGVNGVELDHVTVTDVFGDTVYVGRDDAGNWSSDVWVHDSRLTRTGRHGLTVTAGRRVVIERNVISDTRYSTVDLEPNSPSWGATDVFILDNKVGPGRLLFLSAHGAGPVDDVVVQGNELVGRPMTISVKPPPGERRSNFFVVGNHSDTEAGRTPMNFERIDGLLVDGNRQRVQPERARSGEVGIEGIDICGVDVSDNDFGHDVTALVRSGPTCDEAPPRQVPTPPLIPARRAAELAAQSATPATTTTEPEAASRRGSPDGETATKHPIRYEVPASQWFGLAVFALGGLALWSVMVVHRHQQ